jgi:hypothetical protein
MKAQQATIFNILKNSVLVFFILEKSGRMPVATKGNPPRWACRQLFLVADSLIWL